MAGSRFIHAVTIANASAPEGGPFAFQRCPPRCGWLAIGWTLQRAHPSFLGLPIDPIATRVDASLPISTTSERG
jgi:hypothetical protein